MLQEADRVDVPALAREALATLITELHALEQRIEAIEGIIVREHKPNPASRRRQPSQASDQSPRQRSRSRSRILGVQIRVTSWPTDRFGTAARLKRKQAEARTCVETRRPLSAPIAHGPREIGYAPPGGEDRWTFSMDQGAPRSPTVPAGLAGRYQKDCAHRPGDHGARRRPP